MKASRVCLPNGASHLAWTGWWWSGILIMFGIVSILGTLNIPSIAGVLGLRGLSKNSQKPKEVYQSTDHLYEEGYQPYHPPVTSQEGGDEDQSPFPSTEQPYGQPRLHYPQEMPPQ